MKSDSRTLRRKELGAFYTPEHIVRSLVSWAISRPTDRLLDPSCGDGRFLIPHRNSVGVEGDPDAARVVHQRAPGSLIHQGDFFSWAEKTHERFDCAAGNPPFIRYQRFTGDVRAAAQRLCTKQGVRFTSLSSSWAPFLVAAASVLRPGGRMAFVVPAEIGHAPYAAPLLRYLLGHFAEVQVTAIQEKLFPELSEDCWLLFCRGFGGQTKSMGLRQVRQFKATPNPLPADRSVTIQDLVQWGHRLRPFLLSQDALSLYASIRSLAGTRRLVDMARVGIGYVTGANDFFHLRPSTAQALSIPTRFLLPAVRNGRDLARDVIDEKTIEAWRVEDRPNFLLRVRRDDVLPASVRAYLNSQLGQAARETYKCRNRTPWYSVPDVQVADGFLSYMSGNTPSLVANRAGCVGTNSVHVVRMICGYKIADLKKSWNDPVTELSCEIEGHPLGGGMLKIEPREAARIVIRSAIQRDPHESSILREAVAVMRRWRHYG